jgi:hypothetical protein
MEASASVSGGTVWTEKKGEELSGFRTVGSIRFYRSQCCEYAVYRTVRSSHSLTKTLRDRQASDLEQLL